MPPPLRYWVRKRLYVLRFPDVDSETVHVKIGTSDHPVSRRQALGGALVLDLPLIGWFERDVHMMLAMWHHEGEYFKLPPGVYRRTLDVLRDAAVLAEAGMEPAAARAVRSYVMLERTLESALADFDAALGGPGRLTASARAFSAYFMDEAAGVTPMSSVRLDEAAELYSALLEARGVHSAGAKGRLRRLHADRRLVNNRLDGLGWSPLKAELEALASGVTRKEAS